MKSNGWIIYIYAKILPNFRVGIQANSSAFDIFPQKQSFVENELICLRGSVVKWLTSMLWISTITLYQVLHFFAEFGVRVPPKLLQLGKIILYIFNFF